MGARMRTVRGIFPVGMAAPRTAPEGSKGTDPFQREREVLPPGQFCYKYRLPTSAYHNQLSPESLPLQHFHFTCNIGLTIR